MPTSPSLPAISLRVELDPGRLTIEADVTNASDTPWLVAQWSENRQGLAAEGGRKGWSTRLLSVCVHPQRDDAVVLARSMVPIPPFEPPTSPDQPRFMRLRPGETKPLVEAELGLPLREWDVYQHPRESKGAIRSIRHLFLAVEAGPEPDAEAVQEAEHVAAGALGVVWPSPRPHIHADVELPADVDLVMSGPRFPRLDPRVGRWRQPKLDVMALVGSAELVR